MILRFTLTTLAPATMIGLAALFGGAWPLLAVLYLTGFTSVMDRLHKSSAHANQAGTALCVLLVMVHFALLPIVLFGLTGNTLSTLGKALLFFAAGLFFGQISNANAHELIHRTDRWLHRLGMWVYISLLFGHHTSAHVLVHHRHVATKADPNTSRRGEGFYRYAVRAWMGSFVQGYRAEAARLSRINRPSWKNPYVVYVGGAAGFISAALAIGPGVLLAYVGLASYAQTQLLMSDYVQHYGLVRQEHDGKPEPVGVKHSWNSPHWFSSALMLNATRHSDHHARPAQPYPALTLPKEAPMLPKPLPLMASIALVPPLWRRIMDPLADRWRHAV